MKRKNQILIIITLFLVFLILFFILRGGSGELFVHPLGFSLNLPDGFRTTEYGGEEGALIVFQGSKPGQEFQIFIQPFDEPAFAEASADKPGPLTKERIQGDLPEIIMRNVSNVKIDKAPAIAFEQEEEDELTFETWFVWPEDPYPHGNYLYQITSFTEFEKELKKILKTWRFQE